MCTYKRRLTESHCCINAAHFQPTQFLQLDLRWRCPAAPLEHRFLCTYQRRLTECHCCISAAHFQPTQFLQLDLRRRCPAAPLGHLLCRLPNVLAAHAAHFQPTQLQQSNLRWRCPMTPLEHLFFVCAHKHRLTGCLGYTCSSLPSRPVLAIELEVAQPSSTACCVCIRSQADRVSLLHMQLTTITPSFSN